MSYKNILDDAENPEEAIFVALGAVSVCWENVENAGIFDSIRAKAIGEELIEKLVGWGL